MEQAFVCVVLVDTQHDTGLGTEGDWCMKITSDREQKLLGRKNTGNSSGRLDVKLAVSRHHHRYSDPCMHTGMVSLLKRLILFTTTCVYDLTKNTGEEDCISAAQSPDPVRSCPENLDRSLTFSSRGDARAAWSGGCYMYLYG